MTIIAYYPVRNIDVQITNVIKCHNRTIVFICTLDGSTPFIQWTHGGWAEVDHAQVEKDRLTNIRQVPAPQDGKIIPNFTQEEIDHYRALFPAHSRAKPWKGINSD